jgi:hypothetical protein
VGGSTASAWFRVASTPIVVNPMAMQSCFFCMNFPKTKHNLDIKTKPADDTGTADSFYNPFSQNNVMNESYQLRPGLNSC